MFDFQHESFCKRTDADADHTDADADAIIAVVSGKEQKWKGEIAWDPGKCLKIGLISNLVERRLKKLQSVFM